MVGILGNNISSPPGGSSPPSCVTDADCVPVACCHADACTPRANAPRCSDVVCTQHCIAGTLDCGAAQCVCLGGRCGVQRRG